jgi:hypothetical protein
VIFIIPPTIKPSIARIRMTTAVSRPAREERIAGDLGSWGFGFVESWGREISGS